MTKALQQLKPRFRDPRISVRVALGILLAANLVMAAVVFKPWASSAEDMERELVSLRKEVQDRRKGLEKLRAVVSKIETARDQGDNFTDRFFLNRRTASSTIVAELLSTSQKAGVRQKEVSYVFEPVEGSDNIDMMTVTANYEGSFADLMHFINLVDRSPKFLILESLQAAPQQSGMLLNVALKVNTFVREGPDVPGQPEAVALADQPAQRPPQPAPASPVRAAAPPQPAPVQAHAPAPTAPAPVIAPPAQGQPPTGFGAAPEMNRRVPTRSSFGRRGPRPTQQEEQ